MTHKRDTRPVNLDLFSLSYPITAITSILHRATGFILVLSIPAILWVFSMSLTSPASFATLTSLLSMPILRLVIWGLLSMIFYHLFAGIRHVLMDIGFAESVTVAKHSSIALLAVTVLTMIVIGVWLW